MIPASVQTGHSHFNFLREGFLYDRSQFLCYCFSHFDPSLTKLDDCLDGVDRKVGVTPAIELIIDLKYPSVDVEVACYQLCQLTKEVFRSVDIAGSNGHWDISHLEDPLRPALSAEDLGLLRVTGHNRDRKLDRELNVVLAHFTWNNVALLAVYDPFD